MRSSLYELYDKNIEEMINEEYIESAFELMMSQEPELINYINNFKISSIEKNEDKKIYGTFSNENKTITLDMNSIINENNSIFENKALIALAVLRHEIEHARNLKKIEEFHKDIESLVIKSSLKDYAINHGLDYSLDYRKDELPYLRFKIDEHYDINPGERIAEIKTWKYLVNFLKNKRNTNDLLIARSMLYYSYIGGYKNNNYYLEPPTYEFLLKTGLFHDLAFVKKEFEKKEYSLDKRLMCGLPISYEEYDYDILKKVKLKKKKRI